MVEGLLAARQDPCLGAGGAGGAGDAGAGARLGAGEDLGVDWRELVVVNHGPWWSLFWRCSRNIRVGK